MFKQMLYLHFVVVHLFSFWHAVKYHLLLTGNVMNGPIGKQMVDTLVESSANVEVCILYIVHASSIFMINIQELVAMGQQNY